MNNMKKYISIIFAGLLLTSCVDTVILPDDKTVDEDFWQTKEDVSSMVNGAYKSMLSSNVISRLVVWGDFRSDELIPVTTMSNTTEEDLVEINAANTQTDNTFAAWGSLYSVINNCNIVLSKAQPVMSIDPNYTEGDYNTDCSQMKALRSLCYFYLVRNFRDVPYTTQAYMNSSQMLQLPQSDPDSVLYCCINDLKDAEKNALDPAGFSDWRRVGYMNKDGIDALLADIYLWLGSVHHEDSLYQQCVAYADKVIASKQSQHVPGRNELVTEEYPLAEGTQAYGDIFVTQNAEESIFELQFDGSSNSNTSLCQMYYKYGSNSSSYGYMKASSIFGTAATTGNSVYRTTSDYRFWKAVWAGNTSSESFDVRKLIDVSTIGLTTSPNRDATRTYTYFAQNYNVYRFTDVMLMKAEALTQLATDDADSQLRQAFNLVQRVNARSIAESSVAADSLRWNTFSSKTSMQTLILQERLREFCFEGRRWYDLMRYNYQNVEGVDYSRTLYELSQSNTEFVKNSSDMLSLIIRKYTSGGNAVSAKLRTEPYLYMPIPKSDIEINSLLHQNPVYSDNDDYEKNV